MKIGHREQKSYDALYVFKKVPDRSSRGETCLVICYHEKQQQLNKLYCPKYKGQELRSNGYDSRLLSSGARGVWRL